MSFLVNILTPTSSLTKDLKAHNVTLMTENGQIQVLENHTTLLSRVAPGKISIALDQKNSVQEYFATVGFIKVEKNNITIIADVAESADKIDIERAQKAQKEAEEKLQNIKTLTTEELLKYERKYLRACLRIMVANSRKR